MGQVIAMNRRVNAALLGGVIFCCILAGPGCSSKEPTVADPACLALVAKIDQCDATAKDMPASYRQKLAEHCPDAQKACAAIDTSSASGCQTFMGCLYGE